MRRHAFRRYAEGTCCEQPAGHDDHALMVWRRSLRDGAWYSGVGGVAYRVRPQPRTRAGWLSEALELEGDWQLVGNGSAATFTQAKVMCEEYRENREVEAESPLAVLAKKWEDEGKRLRDLYRPKNDYPRMNGLADQLIACAEELRKELKGG